MEVLRVDPGAVAVHVGKGLEAGYPGQGVGVGVGQGNAGGQLGFVKGADPVFRLHQQDDGQLGFVGHGVFIHGGLKNMPGQFSGGGVDEGVWDKGLGEGSGLANAYE